MSIKRYSMSVRRTIHGEEVVADAWEGGEWVRYEDHVLIQERNANMPLFSKGYEKVTVYYFEAGDMSWMLTNVTADSMDVEETEKNGQEDTHVSGVIELNSKGRWRLALDTYDMITTYHGVLAAAAVEAFINLHGLPVE